MFLPFRVGLVSVLSASTIAIGTPLTVETGSIAPSPAESSPLTDVDVVSAGNTRRMFGLDDSPAVVRQLASASDDASKAVFELGTYFTPDEYEIVATQLGYDIELGRAQAALGIVSAFGGAWIDHAKGGLVTVAFTSISADTEQLVARLLPTAPIQVVEVKHTLVELNAAQHELTTAIAASKLAIDSAVDVTRNGLVAEGADDLRVAESLVADLDLGVPVSFNQATPAAPDTIWYLAGGLGTSGTSGGSTTCSLGLPFLSNDGGYPRPTTAGHCEAALRYIGTDNVAVRITGLDTGQWDTSVLGPILGILTDDILVYNNAGALVGARDLTTKWVPAIGSLVCESQGRSLRTRCGPVVSQNASYGNNDLMLKAQMCSRKGDSGSAAYVDYLGVALGTGNHSGATDNDADCFPADVVYIGTVGWIEYAWDLTLYTSG